MGRNMSEFIGQQKQTGGVLVIKCAGMLDYANFEQNNKIVRQIVQEGKAKIVFDLTDVTYISSSGWTLFLGNLKAVREKKGNMTLAGMKPEVKATFNLLELENLIDCYNTTEEAVKKTG
jgi:anti-sigma B factor antagonist